MLFHPVDLEREVKTFTWWWRYRKSQGVTRVGLTSGHVHFYNNPAKLLSVSICAIVMDCVTDWQTNITIHRPMPLAWLKICRWRLTQTISCIEKHARVCTVHTHVVTHSCKKNNAQSVGAQLSWLKTRVNTRPAPHPPSTNPTHSAKVKHSVSALTYSYPVFLPLCSHVSFFFSILHLTSNWQQCSLSKWDSSLHFRVNWVSSDTERGYRTCSICLC